MVRAQRQLNDSITWFAERRVWRFKYRDPFTGERKFINCNAAKFAEAGIDLPDADVIRKKTKTAQAFARQLQTAFHESLRAVQPATFETTTPTVTAAIQRYFELYDQQAPSYRDGLRKIFEEFARVADDK